LSCAYRLNGSYNSPRFARDQIIQHDNVAIAKIRADKGPIAAVKAGRFNGFL
jgi:hypothetical protein